MDNKLFTSPLFLSTVVTLIVVLIVYFYNSHQEKKEDKEYEPMLTTEELDAMPAQEQVGGQRIMDLLKELETARKERDDAQPGFEMEKPAQDSTNTESVVGS